MVIKSHIGLPEPYALLSNEQPQDQNYNAILNNLRELESIRKDNKKIEEGIGMVNSFISSNVEILEKIKTDQKISHELLKKAELNLKKIGETNKLIDSYVVKTESLIEHDKENMKLVTLHIQTQKSKVEDLEKYLKYLLEKADTDNSHDFELNNSYKEHIEL